MAQVERMESLKTKHEALEEQLSAENRRPSPDYEAIARLKREKLRLKDQMLGLQPH